MIVEIHSAKTSIKIVSKYNEIKMAGNETADIISDETKNVSKVIAERNIPEGSSIVKEAERIQLMNLKRRHHGPTVSNMTFHMSINPSETDRKNDEATVVAMVDEIMEGLGYKDQPYKIYRHNDIAREHYHVVSIRAGKDGKKINDSFERLKLRTILKSLSVKYGFTLEETDYDKRHQHAEEKEEEPRMAIPADVLPKSEKKDEKEKEPTAKTIVPRFKRVGGKPLMEQMREIHADAMKWSFTTFEQYQALLLRRYNIEAGIEKGDYTDDRIVMVGIDDNGKNITNKMNEIKLGVKMLDQIKERIYESEKMYRKEQKTRLEKLAVAAVDRCSSYKEYCELMDRKGVYLVVSWNKDNEPFGVTYLDRATRCAFKGSETKVDIAWLKKTVEAKGWTIEKDRLQALTEKRNSMANRTTRLTKKTDVDPTPSKDNSHVVVEKVGRKQFGFSGVKGAQRSNYESKKKDALDHLEDLLDGTKLMGQGM